jgi:hypothetical protein
MRNWWGNVVVALWFFLLAALMPQIGDTPAWVIAMDVALGLFYLALAFRRWRDRWT